MYRGGCLCGAVRFRVATDLAEPLACHCRQCRRQSGHYFAAVAAPWADITFGADAGLAWYRHTGIAARGFCHKCGSTLFWRGDGSPEVMIAMGALDDTGDLRLAAHYWVADKGAYYDIPDGLPQHDGGDG